MEHSSLTIKTDKEDGQVDVLLNQYKISMDLYIHEDNLVWNKINYLILITTAIFALDRWGVAGFQFITLLLYFFGFITSIIFYIAISNGLDYMLARKVSVFKIEEELKKFGGVNIVNPNSNNGTELDIKLLKKNNNLIMSSTMKAVKLLVMFIAVIWLVMIGTVIIPRLLLLIT